MGEFIGKLLRIGPGIIRPYLEWTNSLNYLYYL
jgi:hypothetical protein